MKALLSALAGSAAGSLLSYVLVRVFAVWYGPRYIHSDSDIGDAYVASLVFMLVCTVAGAVVGFKLHRRKNGSSKRR